MINLMGSVWMRSIGIARGSLLAMVLCCGCSLPMSKTTPVVSFQEAYKAAAAPSRPDSPILSERGPSITMSTQGIQAGDLARWLAREHSVSIICAETLQSRQVQIDVKDMPLIDFLRMVARRLGQELTVRGNVYYLGELRPEDRTVVVRRVYRLSPGRVSQVANMVKGSQGIVSASADGVVVLADTVWACQSLCELLDRVEAAPVPQWCLQLHLISVSDRQARELGIDVTPAVEVSASLAEGVSTPGKIFAGRAALSALLRCARDNGFATVEAQPLLLLEDGQKGSFNRGLRVPVARRVVSPQGTVSVESYESIETGITVSASVREASPDKALISLTVEAREQVGSVEGVPITDGASWTGSVTVQAGGVYLLGEMGRRQRDSEVSGPFQISTRWRDEKSRMQIWAQVIRVGGPVANMVSFLPTSGPLGDGMQSVESESIYEDTSAVDRQSEVDSALDRWENDSADLAAAGSSPATPGAGDNELSEVPNSGHPSKIKSLDLGSESKRGQKWR